MHYIVSTVIRRGLDAHASYQSENGGKPAFQLPLWAQLSFFFTAIAFIIAIITVDYTYGQVVATLAMVESPTAVAYEQIEIEDPEVPQTSKKSNGVPQSRLASEAGPASRVEPTPLFMAQAPITSSLRGTLVHLRRQMGYFSRFRGLSLYIVYSLSYLTLSLITVSLFYEVFGSTSISTLFGTIVAEGLLAGLHMSWTHVVISGPSPKPWFRRLARFSSWKQVVLPAVVVTILQNVAVGVPTFLMQLQGVNKERIQNSPVLALCNGFGLLTLSIVLTYMIVIPLTAVLRRVEGSLLPDTEDTVVPFDRTFGGRLLQVDGEAPRAISMVEAWKSFDSSSRFRIAKVYLKVFGLEMLVMLAFLAATVLQVYFVLAGKKRPE